MTVCAATVYSSPCFTIICPSTESCSHLLIRPDVQHVQTLELSGVIRTQKVGRVRTCTLELKSFDLLEDWLSDRRGLWAHRFDRLAEERGDGRDPDEPQPYKISTP